MARSPSAVLKGRTTKAVKKASKQKELQSELKSLDKQLEKLSNQRTKVLNKLDKLSTPVVKAVESGAGIVVSDGAGDSVQAATA